MKQYMMRLCATTILGWLGIFVIVTICALLLGSCQRVNELHYARDITEQHTETVSITALCVSGDGSELLGFIASGTRISSTKVLTAAHVTREPAGTSCMWMGNQLGDPRGLMLTPDVVDEDRDLATMRVVFGHFDDPALYAVGAKPLLGDTICEVSANPYHIRRCGEVQPSHKEYPGMIDSTMIVEPGNSGSPVYNERGELVGVVSAMWQCRNGQLCGSFVASLDDAEMLKLLQ